MGMRIMGITGTMEIMAMMGVTGIIKMGMRKNGKMGKTGMRKMGIIGKMGMGMRE